MTYAQINYNQIQGINGRYTIHAIGCFITAFSNLLLRKGITVSPEALNVWLISHNDYVDVDDGVRDDVNWDTITKYAPNFVVSATGTGKPTNNDSIVKFIYNSFQTGKPTTHFCLVNDVKAGTIVDSYDGKIKSWNEYPGGPVAWASYSIKKPTGEKKVATPAFIKQAYQAVLHRAADAGGLKHYQEAPYNDPEFILNDLMNSAERKKIETAKPAPATDPDGAKWRNLKTLLAS